MNLQLIGALVGITAYFPIFIGIYKNKIQQNFTTWMLWSTLDFITAITILLQKGNYLLSLGFATGSTIITILLVYKKQVTWTWFETFVSFLVTVCLLVWWQIGDKAGTIASVSALTIASIPQVIDTAKKPSVSPTGSYAIFFFGSLLSFLGGKAWTIEERLFSGASMFLCLLIVLLSLRKNNLPASIQI